MMPRRASAQIGSRGVTRCRYAVESSMRWIFREQGEDYGVDAHVEVVDGELVRGRLVALQIKTGQSHFGEPAVEGGWWFRPSRKHFLYWLGYSIPVAIVLVDLDSGCCYWQLVTESTVERTSGCGWKIRVPADQVLDASAVEPLRSAAEAGGRRVRRPLGTLITEYLAVDLEVHGTVLGANALSEYVIRDHDNELTKLVMDAVGPAAVSGCAILVGESCTGKTRALYEALHRCGTEPGATSAAAAGWRVWPGVNPLPAKRFLDELVEIEPRTVVWLNEAQRYLRDPAIDIRTGIATALLELLTDDSRGPVLILGTLWPEHWRELTRKPPEEQADNFSAARRLLIGNYLQVPAAFTNAEVAAAKGSEDRLLAVAARQVTGTAVTQQLAGAPDLLRRYETASASAQAVLHAAMDARRFGYGEWFPETLLAALAYSYLSGAERCNVEEDPSWLESAIADLVVRGPASGPMLHHDVLGYRLDDFMDHHGRVLRRFEFPPERFWMAVAENQVDSDVQVRMADAAADRLRLRIAVRLYQVAGNAGEHLGKLSTVHAFRGAYDAAERLARLAAEAGTTEALWFLATYKLGRGRPGAESLFQQAADLGDVRALDWLADRLEGSGHQAAAEAVARRAVDLGSWMAMVTIAELRDFDDPDGAEQLLYDLPEEIRWDALAALVSSRDSLDDYDGAERLALTLANRGHPDALLELADDRRDRSGDRSRFGNEAARRLLAHMPDPETPEYALRAALSYARARSDDEARALLKKVSGTQHLDNQVAAIADTWPQHTDQLLEILRALDEHLAADRLTDHIQQQEKPELSDSDNEGEPSRSPGIDEPDDEVADAYAILARFHALHGEFEHAESLAMAASRLGNPMGLIDLGQELLQRRELADAERLALCATNMGEGPHLGRDAGRVLAEARRDNRLLEWGLDADGTTSEPW
ncbi:DUF4365 domain-containing protein [Nocardia carnea]|uniref:DUF4365 domain-containing protein n=1 Tax=Nocardia carnea TaxID=37328 RepID=UPI0032AF3597